MAEYIDKNATVGILEAMSRNADCECIKKRLEKAAKRVSTIPAADVAPVVHGRWLCGEDYMFCSKCGMQWNYCDNDTQDFKYCPNCGAKMDEGGDDVAERGGVRETFFPEEVLT